MSRIMIVGGGVSGSEAGTDLGQHTKVPLEIIEIEYEPQRKFGGWGFQSFPNTETTNLAMRKMYLGDDPNNILEWAKEAAADKSKWPEHLRSFEFYPNRPMPRFLMREYVKWRRRQVNNPLVKYTEIPGEAMHVALEPNGVCVRLNSGTNVFAERLLMASGSISVKVPQYLEAVKNSDHVIIDPLILAGHERRASIPTDARVLVLGTGLTGDEQINVLLKRGLNKLSLFSRNGKRHYSYGLEQTNIPIKLTEPPAFMFSETPEEFNSELNNFYASYICKGHSPEDVIDSIRPFWDQIRKDLGGCVKAAERIKEFKRTLACNSIGVSWEVSENFKRAESEGKVTYLNGDITHVEHDGKEFQVTFDDAVRQYDWIINAVGRNIIRHPIWEQMLADGIAIKHAGIGVQVTETGRMLNGKMEPSDRIWVIGMARAGDHTLRHGYLGNTAFNVPQVRSHIYGTTKDIIADLERN